MNAWNLAEILFEPISIIILSAILQEIVKKNLNPVSYYAYARGKRHLSIISLENDSKRTMKFIYHRKRTSYLFSINSFTENYHVTYH